MNWSEVLQSQETFPAIMSRMADTNPDQLFVQTIAGASATWGELRISADIWAARFVALGVRKGDIVATILDADLESLQLWLGLASIGAIEAATNAEFRGRMLAYAINNCGPSLIVVSKHYLPFLEAVAQELETVTQVLVLDHAVEVGATKSKLPTLTNLSQLQFDIETVSAHIIAPQWHDIACITYTSGTTGVSKAVMLPWGQLNAINLGIFPSEDLRPSDVFYCTTSHAHFGSKSIPYHAAMTGGKIVLRSRFSLNSFWDDITRFGITTASLVGSMADMLMNHPDSPAAQTSLRNMFMAPLGPSYRQFIERFGVRICTVYNSTEGGVALCSGWNPDNPRTVGRLRQGYPGFEVRIVDENDFEIPDGRPGELIVRASVPWTMNAGYFNNPQATATAWRNGWFHTGDILMRTRSGDYIFVDRLKDVIRRRGENISSQEIEADVLLNPSIVECAAVAVPAGNEGDEALLFAVKRADSAITPWDLCADLERRMARFMVPRYIEFVESLPKTQATLRIMKAELRQRGVGVHTWDRENPSLSI